LNTATIGGDSDETLAVRAAGLSDTKAFEALMRRHQQRVYYLLRRLTGEPAVAEELCQETFLHAWRKLGTFDGRDAGAAGTRCTPGA
jgi:RNA polymerase sigma-70 factor, ECF subfamily